MKESSGLGMMFIRGEGAPLHPEDGFCPFIEDREKFMAQAKKYYDYYGLFEEWEQFKRRYE